MIRKVVKKTKELSFSARAGVIYRLHDYFQLVYMNSVCPIRGEISARFSMTKFLYVIVIPFLHCFHLYCKKKSHYGLTS